MTGFPSSERQSIDAPRGATAGRLRSGERSEPPRGNAPDRRDFKAELGALDSCPRPKRQRRKRAGIARDPRGLSRPAIRL